MKIIFAGVGGAFTTQKYYQSNIVVDDGYGNRLLIDCGTDARFSLGELGCKNHNVYDWLDAVYISHLHSDHVGGLEWLGYCSYLAPDRYKKIKLYISKDLVNPLWETLRGGMEIYSDFNATLDTYFEVVPIDLSKCVKWKHISLELVKTLHVSNSTKTMLSYGLTLEEDGQYTFVTTDTQFFSNYYEPFFEKSSLILHDCETYDRRSGVHAHYNDLKTLPEKFKRKMWLYHYGPDPKQNPANDGFLGFATKGQIIDTKFAF